MTPKQFIESRAKTLFQTECVPALRQERKELFFETWEAPSETEFTPSLSWKFAQTLIFFLASSSKIWTFFSLASESSKSLSASPASGSRLKSFFGMEFLSHRAKGRSLASVFVIRTSSLKRRDLDRGSTPSLTERSAPTTVHGIVEFISSALPDSPASGSRLSVWL